MADQPLKIKWYTKETEQPGTSSSDPFGIKDAFVNALGTSNPAAASAGMNIAVSQFYENEMHAQANQLVREINSYVKKATMSKEDVAKEAANLDNRIRANRFGTLSYYMLAQAGVPGALQLMQESEKEYATLEYLREEATTNPEKYIMYKLADYTNKLAPYIQARAGVLPTFQLNKAQAVQAVYGGAGMAAYGVTKGADSGLSMAESNVVRTLIQQGKYKEADEFLRLKEIDLSGDASQYNGAPFSGK